MSITTIAASRAIPINMYRDIIKNNILKGMITTSGKVSNTNVTLSVSTCDKLIMSPLLYDLVEIGDNFMTFEYIILLIPCLA